MANEKQITTIKKREPVKFKSSYLLRVLCGEYNPFRGNHIIITDSYFEHSKRNWFLISKDTNKIHFQSMSGIFVDKHLFGASIKIDKMVLHGFGKKTADRIKELCSEYISLNSQRGTTEELAATIQKAITSGFQGGTSNFSKADELKKLKDLLDQGALTQEEFEEQKKALLN